ncbi:MAG: YjbQ family protein [Candidatus Thorarchaeota archaeon]
MERLYLPDFRCIFGEAFSNPFLYGQIDSLIWPIFKDIKKSSLLQNLLKLKNTEGRELFYIRNISIEDEIIELNCSNIDYGLIQAMNLGRNYGISNLDVQSVVKVKPNTFKGILSFDCSEKSPEENIISKIEKMSREIPIVGIAVFPSFTKLDINNENNAKFNEVLNYCKLNNIFLKIDIGNFSLPSNYPEYVSYEKIKLFLSKHMDLYLILSGLDLSNDVSHYYQLMKYYNNLWIEVDPRTFGGMTPSDCFNQLFGFKGFTQNAWYRLTIGSATPSLEISQIFRGFLEATENLPFSHKCLLRTWAFRNLNRLNFSLFKPVVNIELQKFNPVRNVDKIQEIENQHEIIYEYKIKMRSYSITQLIFLTDTIKEVFSTIPKNLNAKNGEIFVKSYHTTIPLIINEHEFGNYLDLHYKFSEISNQNTSQFLHTVRALENRADFNYYDHELASTYGNRQITIPVVNGNLEIGNRENFYALATFGPRVFYLYIKIKLIKQK